MSGRASFYYVFCKKSKEFSQHGGQTKAGHDHICQACLDDDAGPGWKSPELAN